MFGYRTEIFPFPERTPHQNGSETFNDEEKEKKTHVLAEDRNMTYAE